MHKNWWFVYACEILVRLYKTLSAHHLRMTTDLKSCLQPRCLTPLGNLLLKSSSASRCFQRVYFCFEYKNVFEVLYFSFLVYTIIQICFTHAFRLVFLQSRSNWGVCTPLQPSRLTCPAAAKLSSSLLHSASWRNTMRFKASLWRSPHLF